jgi:hypothetical protein
MAQGSQLNTGLVGVNRSALDRDQQRAFLLVLKLGIYVYTRKLLGRPDRQRIS